MLKAIIYVKIIDIGKPLKSRYWPHVSTATAKRKHTESFCQSVSKQVGEGGREKQEKKMQSFLCCT